MNFKSDYEKLKYMYKEKTKEINNLRSIINNLKSKIEDLNYSISVLENKVNTAYKKNQQLSLLLDEYVKEMRFLKDGKTKDNK